MIEFQNVTKKFGQNKAVDNVNFKIEKGEFCVLIGPSGCGKSTTMRMINRLIEPTEGKIFIGGEDSKSQSPVKLRRTMGYVIQSIGLFPHMTVAENISVVPKLLDWSEDEINDRLSHLMELVELDGQKYKDTYPSQLSGGQAQRVGVARALAADPEILLMDEPFGALDPITRGNLQHSLLNIQKELNKTIVFVTHDIDEAITLADKVAVMSKGRIVQFDTPENVLENPSEKFVTEFIGTDRALKRLTRKEVGDYVTDCITINENTDMDSAAKEHGNDKYAWVTDDTDKVTGWVKTKQTEGTVLEKMTDAPDECFLLKEDATLKEAVSCMLEHSVQSLPVIDKDGNLLGEIKFGNIISDE